MKNVILKFKNPKEKARKLPSKILFLENEIPHKIIEDENIKVLAGIIEKNAPYISDMSCIILGNENFNPSKIRYKHKFEKLKEQDQIIELCDKMLIEKDDEINKLRKENEELKTRNVLLTLKQNQEEIKLNFPRTEIINLNPESTDAFKVIYPNEVSDVILKLIKKEISQMSGSTSLQNSRKFEILKTINDSNQISNFDNEIMEEFQKSLKDDGSVSRKEFNRLEKFGFNVNIGNKNHVKIMLKGNTKHKVIVGSTISDNKAKKNLISLFYNTFFGY